jgi:hypothetical protein
VDLRFASCCHDGIVLCRLLRKRARRIIRPLFDRDDRFGDLTNYSGKIAHLADGGAALGSGFPVFNYPAPAAYVYAFFLRGFPHHSVHAFLAFLLAGLLLWAFLLWKGCAHPGLGTDSSDSATVKLSCQGGDLDSKSKVLQTVDEPQNLLAFCAVVEVASTEVLVEGTVFEHVISCGEQRQRRWPSLAHAWNGGAGIEPGGNFPWCGRPPRCIG